MKPTFLGGAGTVTGSKYLLETDSTRALVDCGLYQGVQSRRDRNWHVLAAKPASIEANARESRGAPSPLVDPPGARRS